MGGRVITQFLTPSHKHEKNQTILNDDNIVFKGLIILNIFSLKINEVDLFRCKIIQNLTLRKSHLISGRVDATRCSKLKGGFPPVPPALTLALSSAQVFCCLFQRLI